MDLTAQGHGEAERKLCILGVNFLSFRDMEDPFQPTWPRALAAVAVAAIGFALPQEVPLEFFPLNTPSPGLQYLEITCAANTTGLVEIFLNTGRGFNSIETIQWPVSPGDAAYTYTFPLPDAPLVGLRLAPFEGGAGVLTVTSFRVIDRREREIRRFTGSDFRPRHEIASIEPASGGWKIVTVRNATHPYLDVRLGGPLIAEGMSLRNLERCLLSWGYLSLMTWILLLAVYFSLRCLTGVRGALRACAFLALVATLFSAVGNRGLIRASFCYARFASTRHGP